MASGTAVRNISVEQFEAEEEVRMADNRLYFAQAHGRPASVIEAKERDAKNARQALEVVIDLGR